MTAYKLAEVVRDQWSPSSVRSTG